MVINENLLTGLDEKQKAYINERVINQIEWFDAKSKEKQIRYKRCTVIGNICTVIIPVVAGLYGAEFATIIGVIVATLGAIATLSSVINKLGDYHNLWIHYRNMSESLKRELYFFLYNINDYQEINETRFNSFVRNIELIHGDDLDTWRAIDAENKLQ